MGRPARHTFAGLTLLALLGDHSRASAPVPTKLTACVLDGFMITLDGYYLKPMTAANAPLNLTAYADKKISVEGDLSPGDWFRITSDVAVLGACSAEEKLKVLPTLAQIYQRQANDQPPASPPPAPRDLKTPLLDCAAAPGDACYQLVRVPKSGGSATVLRRAPLGGDVFVDARFVYWTEGDNGAWRMMRRSKTSGRTTAIARGSLRGPLARAPGGFYGEVGQGLSVLPDNGKPRQLVSQDVSEVAVDRDAIYWSEFGPDNTTDLFARARAGGRSRLLAGGLPVAACLVASAGRLYWANLNVPPLGGAQIVGMSVQGGSPRVLVATNLMMFPWALAVDARALYWVEWRGGGYALYSAPIEGGAAAAALLGVAPAETMTRDNRDHIELDATHVYWNARTSVARVAKAGGVVEEVARVARGDVMSFAIDDRDVYLAVVIF